MFFLTNFWFGTLFVFLRLVFRIARPVLSQVVPILAVDGSLDAKHTTTALLVLKVVAQVPNALKLIQLHEYAFISLFFKNLLIVGFFSNP